MDIKGFATESAGRMRSDGLQGVRWSADRIWHFICQQANGYFDSGNSIYAAEWDLLMIVDACRYDLMEDVKDEYNFISDMTSCRSVGSTTRNWMAETFTPDVTDEMAETAYLSGNPWSEDHLVESNFAKLEHIWKNAWIEPGTVPPEAVTDATIRAGREGDFERIIAHYMQPHYPFIREPDLGPGKILEHFGDQPKGDIWDQLQAGNVSTEVVWGAYRDNLRVVLDDISRLLKNIDAQTVVITSDHGNAIGEWGFYGHRPNVPFSSMRKVPWVETTATDKDTAELKEWVKPETTNRDDQLSALGYI